MLVVCVRIKLFPSHVAAMKMMGMGVMRMIVAPGPASSRCPMLGSENLRHLSSYPSSFSSPLPPLSLQSAALGRPVAGCPHSPAFQNKNRS